MNTKGQAPILVVEDNPADFSLIKIHLKDASIKNEVLHAETFFEAIDHASNQEISLVLLDLSLPDSTGFKTLSNFIEKVPNVPVIVMTGINNEIVGNQAIKAGAQDFLVKGQYDGKLLGRSIRYSIQRYKTQLKLEEVASELAISEKRYLDAQQMARFGNWEVDLVSNEMKWTDEIYRIFGFQPNSFQPTLSGYMNYVHLEDKSKVDDFFENAVKDGQLHEVEHRIVVEGKNILYLSLQAKAYFEEINNKLLLVGVLQDITERKISEQLIIEKNITSKTSKIKEEALADMSFHIRTPLSSIINLLYLLENTSVSTQQTEYLDGLKTSVDDLSIMINNLLNFSVLVSEKITIDTEEIMLRDFLQGIEKVVRIKAENAHIKFDLDLDPNLPDKIETDPNKLTQILYNLADQAIKNSRKGDAVQLNLGYKKDSNQQDLLQVAVIDEGKGLSKSEIKEILEADKLLQHYSEQKEDVDSNHVGMAIVTKLIKSLGGYFDIQSELGEGTSVRTDIPVKVARKIVSTTGNKPNSRLKILLVEDHFLNQIATKKVLTTWSELVSVDIAENGLICVEKYREHGYDIILMDLQMPVMNGLEAARKIREKSNVPIIALTANSSKQEADRCFDIGINDYMAKPFKPQDLYSKIMTLLLTVTN